jgi:hypothetical protein
VIYFRVGGGNKIKIASLKDFMERIDWERLVARLATKVEQIQSNHDGRLGRGGRGWTSFLSGNGVWDLLIGTGRDTERINQLTVMIRLAGHLTLLEEIDVALDKQFPIIERPLSEVTLRLTIARMFPENNNDAEMDLSVEMLSDAIDCILSRLKRRVMRAAFSDIYAAPAPAVPTFTAVAAAPVNNPTAPVNESIVVDIPVSETSSSAAIADNAEEVPSNNECIIA